MYIHLEPGNSSVLLTVPHDGGIKIPNAATRTETQQWELAGGQDPRDIGTRDLARSCRVELGRFGIVPSLLQFDLHRSHVDVNRSPEREPYADGFRGDYESFHVRLNGEIGRILEQHTRCLLIDIHGYIGSPGPEEYDIVVGSDSHRTCPSGTDHTIAAQLATWRVVFSPDPKQRITTRYRGGWIVRKMAAEYGNHGLEAVQLEFNLHMRREPIRTKIASELAEVIQGLVNI